MKKPRLGTFRIGTPAIRGEGLRIAVTRHPQRGVSKEKRAEVGCFDVWLPVLAPSAELVARARAKGLEHEPVRRSFFAAYEREILARAESRGALELLAAVVRRTPLSIGCFCEVESQCHRSRLRSLIEKMASAS